MKDRVKTLEDISGMTVLYKNKHGVSYFQFMRGKQTIKTVFTYPKAKVFAEGVAIGIDIGSKHHTPC